MPWARLEDDWHDHPKTVAAGLEAAGLWVMCLTWAHRARRRSRHPGVVPDTVLARFAGNKAPKLAARLYALGMFDAHTEHGWPIHDFTDYLPRYDSEKAAESGRKGGRAKAESKRTASEPPDERQQNGKRNLARADAGASARRNPGPGPVVMVDVSSRPHTDPAEPRKPTTDDLDSDKIAQALQADADWVTRVATDILSRATGPVTKPTAYVLRAIGDDPDRYRPARTPPRLDQLCHEHARPADTCPHCRTQAGSAT